MFSGRLTNIRLLFTVCIFVCVYHDTAFAKKRPRRNNTGVKTGLESNKSSLHNNIVTQPITGVDANNEMSVPEEVHSIDQDHILTKEANEQSQAHNVLKTINETLPPVLHVSPENHPYNLLPHSKEIQHEQSFLDETVEFNFEKADLSSFVKEIETIFDVTFMTDDIIEQGSKQVRPLSGNKISFKTNKPLSKKSAWSLFVDFLAMANFTIVPDGVPNRFKIKSSDTARKAPLPTFFGVDISLLPTSDQLIRYVYFVENSSLRSITTMVDALRSPNPYSDLIILEDHKGFILTDKAYNVKTIVTIIKEIDKVSMPASLSIIKLKRIDAQQVKDILDTVNKTDDAANTKIFNRKQPTSLYFPEGTRIIAEPRTNSLILLGTRETNERIEKFIVESIDIDIEQPYSGLHTYQLKYIDAETVADIMNNVCQFGGNTQASKYGGVRGGDKYLESLSFVAERETNRVLVRGRYEDFLIAQKIMAEMDEKQPQIAIDILLVSVNLSSQKQLGAQIRSKVPSGTNQLLGNNIKFQTSGLFQTGSIVQNNTGPGVDRLLGNLISLVNGTTPGNTIITLGQDLFGIWGIFQALNNTVNAQIIANPFLVATNQTPATLEVGTTRRVQTGTIVGSAPLNTLGDYKASLKVVVTPLINSDGMISLALDIVIEQFTQPDNPSSAEKTIKRVKTTAIAADKEVLALGGLIKTKVLNNTKKVPLLGDIPLLGWFFKNKDRTEEKDDLLLLISPRIIGQQKDDEQFNQFTKLHLDDYAKTCQTMEMYTEMRDPVNKFFSDSIVDKTVDNFLFKRNKKVGLDSALKNQSESTVELNSSEKSNNSPQLNTMEDSKFLQQSTAVAGITHENKKEKPGTLSLSRFFDDKKEKTV